jgi:glycine cleavage system aminomethyltransferase T
MSPPTYHPSTIYIEIDVSGLSHIDAERYFDALLDFIRAGNLMPCGCRARGRMDLEEVEE